MISSRYAPVVCVLLTLALIPTIIHSYSRAPLNDGRMTTEIATTLDGYRGQPSDRNATWGKRRFDSDDWFERIYSLGPASGTVRLTVVRSYDAKALYHHPELAVTYRDASFNGKESRRFAQHPEIPVHVLKPAAGVRATALYVLLYDTRFIDNPIAFQIRTAGELLLSKRKPTTLFYAFQGATPASAELENSPAATLLFAAVESFLTSK